MNAILKVTLVLTNPSFITRSYSNSNKCNLIELLKTMPKENKHIIEAQKQRIKIKQRLSKYVPGKVTVQVLGSGAEGAPKALYMFTDNSRYLFNCGEGTQRLAHEHKMKLSKLEHIFITEPTWNNIGGLPGVSLTIQDVGVPQITLHGPEGLDELFIATRRFVVLRDLTIRMAECTSDTNFEDNVMRVTYVPISRVTPEVDQQEGTDASTQIEIDRTNASTSTRSSRTRRRSGSRGRDPHREYSRDREANGRDEFIDDTDYYAHERKRRKRSRNRSRPRSSSEARDNSLIQQISHEERENTTTMCYICRLQPRPGALDFERCVEKNVPTGPLLGQLKAGMDITLPDGTVVKSSDVCLPDDPGPVMLVVDCPSQEYLDSFVNNEMFKKHQSTAICDNDRADLVVHFTPSNILLDARYREWVDKFSPSTQHLVLNDANSCMGSAAVHRIQYKLNLLHDDIFPLLGDHGTKIMSSTDECPNKKQKTDNSSEISSTIELLTPNQSEQDGMYLQSNTFCKFHLRPKKGLDRENELYIDPKQYIEETMTLDGIPELLRDLSGKLETQRKKMYINPYPRILFLGTGSCIPNKTRNTSGILLETSDTTNILMDCGEGTYGQLVRFFGVERARTVLCNLKAVYVSHLHADHHIGLVGLLKGRRKAFEQSEKPAEPLLLLAPKQILAWLQFYHRRFEKIDQDYEIIGNADLSYMDFGSKKLSFDDLSRINQLEMKSIYTVPVRHCPNAFGVRFNHQNGWSITYSGDTMPSDQLAVLGQSCNLLIHEATMEDDLMNEAIFKMHSTTSQAIMIGQKMKAKHVMLTHFSQRYAKLPRFNENFASNIGIAFDNMYVRLDELPLVPLFYPALKVMFAEHYEELESKAVKRQLKAERQEASKTKIVTK